MKPGVSYRRPVPDVVQPGRRYQGTIGQPESLSNMFRPVPNTLDMPPPSRQLGQVPLGENPRISGRYHGFELRRSIKQHKTWCRTGRAGAGGSGVLVPRPLTFARSAHTKAPESVANTGWSTHHIRAGGSNVSFL